MSTNKSNKSDKNSTKAKQRYESVAKGTTVLGKMSEKEMKRRGIGK